MRLSSDPRTKTHVTRRTAEGLSNRDIMRRLKRYIVREVYRAITRPLPLAPRGAELRELRTAAGLPLYAVAGPFGITIHWLSRVERGIARDPDFQTRIHTWFTDPDTPQIAARHP